MRAFIIIIVFLFTFLKSPFCQISEKGLPLETKHLKSAVTPVVEMQNFSFEELKQNALLFSETTNRLKPFQFAHAFTVNLNTQNSGEWVLNQNNIYVWKLNIKSKGAESLNLIFEHFKLPEKARLFVYSKDMKHILGAYTSRNNKQSGKFAISPVEGDEITIQYEVPENQRFDKNFEITRVNHDYVGILKYKDRRPLGITAGECNIDVNCEIAREWEEVKNSVCRLIVNGREICTGTLVNNTAEDQKPYIISAAHCYDKQDYAETTLYTFNYESPFCAPLDGDPSHSISGASMKAQFDSLDFALVEMSVIPPPEFRAFFSGWDHSGKIPDSSASLHHPQGDIKKIAIDEDEAEFSDFNSNYTKNGFIKILRWENGVTENGSSGGPLFNNQQNLIGTLTGGVATCNNPVKDYFARFDKAWNFVTDHNKQLKHWLDPLNLNVQYLSGKNFNTNEEYCEAFTNLNDIDKHRMLPIYQSGEFSGYWGGTNTVGITEIAERFTIYGNVELSGISLGVGKISDASDGIDSEITLNVYIGSLVPETLIYSKTQTIKSLTQNAMNFIGFDEIIKPSETFFIGFDLSKVQTKDTFVVFQSLREEIDANFAYMKQNDNWLSFKQLDAEKRSASNIFELIACNIDKTINDTPKIDNPFDILIYPNPSNAVFNIEAGMEINPENIKVYNLIGQNINVTYFNKQMNKITFDLSDNIPGVYFVRFNNGKNLVTKKISYVPW